MMPVRDLLPVLQVSPTLSPTQVLARKFREPAVSSIAASASSVRLGTYSFSMRQYLELGGQGLGEGGDTRHWGLSAVLHWAHCRQSPLSPRHHTIALSFSTPVLLLGLTLVNTQDGNDPPDKFSSPSASCHFLTGIYRLTQTLFSSQLWTSVEFIFMGQVFMCL